MGVTFCRISFTFTLDLGPWRNPTVPFHNFDFYYFIQLFTILRRPVFSSACQLSKCGASASFPRSFMARWSRAVQKAHFHCPILGYDGAFMRNAMLFCCLSLHFQLTMSLVRLYSTPGSCTCNWHVQIHCTFHPIGPLGWPDYFSTRRSSGDPKFPCQKCCPFDKLVDKNPNFDPKDAC
jgi:hypothetical protein